ncbi:hypothetical protein HY230_07200 [Candidatus Acetothermia bacterium]|nr:hypothetical protein [Candidatus Acetothermia bacterium]
MAVFHRLLSWRVLLGYAGLMACGILILGVSGNGQPQDKGIVLLKEESSGAPSKMSALGDLILEPLQLSASLGYTAGGVVWTEFSAETGLWLGDIHISSAAELRGFAFSLSVEAEMQLGQLGLTAGVRWSSAGAQLSGGVRTTFENFTVAARVDAGIGGLSANVHATTKLGDLDLYGGAGLAGTALSASAGATLPLPGNLITLSAGASFDGAGLKATGGADLLLSSSLSLSANASVGTTGVTTTLGGQMSIDTLEVSGFGTWSGENIGVTANGKFVLSAFTLSGTLRIDENSVSTDVGVSTQWGALIPSLTVGLDQQGFKLVQLEVKGEFNVLGWLPK